MENGDEGELVERGSLRVDRARALEKLSRFQLGDPADGLSFWLRCAVAGGASRIDLEPSLTSFELSFDGFALRRDFLEDPYAALFEDRGDRRLRHAAYGLLWARRLGGRLALASGGPGARWRLVAAGGGAERLEQDWGDRGGTVLTVTRAWTGLLRRPWSPPDRLIKGSLGTGPALFVSGRRVTSPPGADAGLRVDLGRGAWALMRPSREPGRRRSSAIVHVDGVAAGRFEFPVRSLPTESLVEFPDAKLDAAQKKAVQDAALDELIMQLGAHERTLLEPALDSRPAPDSELAAAVRAACRVMLADATNDRQDALLARLWDAPLYRYKWGGPHSLRDVAARPDMDGDLVALAGTEAAELHAFLTRIRARGRAG